MTILPVTFLDYKRCPHCLQSKIILLDNKNRIMDEPIYSIEKLKCKNCGSEYFPRWILNEDGNLILVAGDYCQIKELSKQIIQYNLDTKPKQNVYGLEFIRK